MKIKYKENQLSRLLIKVRYRQRIYTYVRSGAGLLYLSAESQYFIFLSLKMSKLTDERSTCFEGEFKIPLLKTKILLHWALLKQDWFFLSINFNFKLPFPSMDWSSYLGSESSNRLSHFPQWKPSYCNNITKITLTPSHSPGGLSARTLFLHWFDCWITCDYLLWLYIDNEENQ